MDDFDEALLYSSDDDAPEEISLSASKSSSASLRKAASDSAAASRNLRIKRQKEIEERNKRQKEEKLKRKREAELAVGVVDEDDEEEEIAEYEDAPRKKSNNMQIFFDDEEELAIEVSEANAASSGSRKLDLGILKSAAKHDSDVRAVAKAAKKLESANNVTLKRVAKAKESKVKVVGRYAVMSVKDISSAKVKATAAAANFKRKELDSRKNVKRLPATVALAKLTRGKSLKFV